MARIKICGLSRTADIEMVNIAKPDYIGFVFAESKRQIDKVTAARLKMLLNPTIKAVGVFVNEAIETITGLCRESIIDIIQLHGDETEDYIKKLKASVHNPIIKAVRIKSGCDKKQTEFKSSDYLLFDTYKNNQYGGSGEAFDWSLIAATDKPIFLAGGINQDNVSEAIKQTDPYCIDVSSGVETNGYKDFNKIINIINTVRSVK
jgi:phosphoribosylanthranilate isomerase